MSKTSIAPRHKEIINKENYDNYISALVCAKKKFPVKSKNKINISAIARACGFCRQVLYTTLKDTFKNDIKKIGLETVNGSTRKVNKGSDFNENNKSKSNNKHELNHSDQDILDLKMDVILLEKKLKTFELKVDEEKAIIQEMIQFGRRFSL